jgi:hypothetical protein
MDRKNFTSAVCGESALAQEQDAKNHPAREKKCIDLIFAIDLSGRIVFSVPPERRFGGIGRRARLKIEYLRVWVRVPQPLFFQ